MSHDQKQKHRAELQSGVVVVEGGMSIERQRKTKCVAAKEENRARIEYSRE